MDIGNRCVCCGEDTSVGSGNFVNRIPADGEYESYDKQGNLVFSDGEYRDGWLCEECQQLECEKCSKVTTDYSFGREINGEYFDVVCNDCYDWEEEHEKAREAQ